MREGKGENRRTNGIQETKKWVRSNCKTDNLKGCEENMGETQ
jgi:hypothetical protein